MRTAWPWLALFAALFVFRWTHREILWVEEAYPAAAAVQLQHGLALYRDFQFDKPPLSAAVYLLWGGASGWPLRLAGGAYVWLCCALAFAVARRWWSEREGWLAALLLAFYLTFGIPAAVMALAPDLLTLLPALAMAWALSHGRGFAAGLALAVAIGCNGKALLLAPLLAFGPRTGWLGLAAGVALPLAFVDARAMWEQVWTWGAAYSRDTPVATPLREGFVRTLAWLGFQATAALGAVWLFWRERSRPAAMLAAWTALGLAMAVLGLRFSPRYYLVLLPPLTLAAARGLCLMPAPVRWAALALLAIPALRFGPKYVELATNPALVWSDTAMNRDSQAAAWRIGKGSGTIFVWGYRPDLLVYTRQRLGAPFLDSQPLTGVLADRHLTRSGATFPELAAANRRRLAATAPDWVVDGLGPYNPALAIAAYPDLAGWLARYDLAAETPSARIYRRRR